MGKRIQEFPLKSLSSKVVNLGYVGENEHTEIVIDCSEVLWDYPNAVVSAVVQPPVGDLYPVVVTRDEDNVIWTVSASDVVYAGNGQIQLTFTNDGEIVKSAIGMTRISQSIETTGEAPTPMQNWMDEANAVLAEIEDMTVAASGLPAGSNPTATVSDVSGHKHIAFGIPQGAKGDPGDATIDDTAGVGDSTKVWSADKTATEVNSLSSAINVLEDVVPNKVNKPQTNPNGTNGQLLKTLGNGQTEWTNAGTPTDEQVENAVYAWLEDHPEATTTVQEGSLTEEKFTDDALNSIKNGVYTLDVSKFGGYSDGTHAEETEEAINDALAWAKENGYYRVFIPDGEYLIVGYEYSNSSYKFQNCGITPPSDIQITLAPNAIIKIQPNISPTYCAIFARDKNNVIIEGGKIVGDRPNHDYTTVSSTHEQGFGIVLYGCHNFVIRNVEFYDFTGDCIALAASGWYGQENYNPTLNIRIINCNLYNTRRTAISIAGTKNALVGWCHIHDIGTMIGGIDGVMPRAGIDIEGYMESGVLLDEPYGINVSNNYFDRNRLDITLFTANKAIVTNNHFESGVDCAYAYQSILSDNIFYCPDSDNNKNGVYFQGSRSIYNNQTDVLVEGNLINGFNVGMYIVGNNIAVNSNLIVNSKSIGISLYASVTTTKKISISNNTIIGGEKGLRIHGQENISIDGNKIYSVETPITFYLNNGNGISITNNLFDTFTGVLMNVNYRANGENKFVFANNIIRNATFDASKWGSFGLLSVDECLDADIINNVFEDISLYTWIVGIENSSLHPKVGKINIVGNYFKNIAQYYTIISRSQHTPQIMIANNVIFVSSSNQPTIYIPYDSDKACSGIIGNYIIPEDNTVILTTAIRTSSNGIGLISKNILMIGTIDAVATDTLVDNYIKAFSDPVIVTGSTPSITALAGVRYICGECDTLNIDVPASGIVDVVFESGSTPTVLTVTPPTGMTIRWANGFDPANLEANTTYEINIMDGCYGVVGIWT